MMMIRGGEDKKGHAICSACGCAGLWFFEIPSACAGQWFVYAIAGLVCPTGRNSSRCCWITSTSQ